MDCRADTRGVAIEDAYRRLQGTSFGWLSAADEVRAQVDQIQDFAAEVRDAGFSHVLLLGMGGAILPAEVLSFAFGSSPGYPELVILDSTDPGAIAEVEARISLMRTLFVVADKTGESIETSALHAYFAEKVRVRRGDEAGRQFVAITDSGSSLEWRVHQQGMSALFVNDEEVPDGFAALSYFGMVPAALAGVDIVELLTRARGAVVAWRPDAAGGGEPVAGLDDAENPAVELGAAIAGLAQAGMDKLTIVCSPGVGNFGSWIEGVIAGSTGKKGEGVFPVDVEPLAAPDAYGDDRQFVYVRLESEADAGQDEALARLERAGVPVHHLSLRDRYDLGAAFVLWEIAAVSAAAVLGVDPFALPDVAEGTGEELQALVELEEGGFGRSSTGDGSTASQPDDERPVTATVRFDLRDAGLGSVLRGLVDSLAPPDFVALQAWVTPGNDTWLELQAMRDALLRERGVASAEGFAPRSLPITGQLQKGGPSAGLVVQLVSDGGPALEVPGQPYTFARLKHAQSLGDLQALSVRGRRVLRVDVGVDAVAGLRAFREMLERALAEGTRPGRPARAA